MHDRAQPNDLFVLLPKTDSILRGRKSWLSGSYEDLEKETERERERDERGVEKST